MKLHDYPETDSPNIELNVKPGAETREVAHGVNVDIDAGGAIVEIGIDRASRRLHLATLETVTLPVGPSRAA